MITIHGRSPRVDTYKYNTPLVVVVQCVFALKIDECISVNEWPRHSRGWERLSRAGEGRIKGERRINYAERELATDRGKLVVRCLGAVRAPNARILVRAILNFHLPFLQCLPPLFTGKFRLRNKITIRLLAQDYTVNKLEEGENHSAFRRRDMVSYIGSLGRVNSV